MGVDETKFRTNPGFENILTLTLLILLFLLFQSLPPIIISPRYIMFSCAAKGFLQLITHQNESNQTKIVTAILSLEN